MANRLFETIVLANTQGFKQSVFKLKFYYNPIGMTYSKYSSDNYNNILPNGITITNTTINPKSKDNATYL